jgi:lipopolysaccharide assembly protein B
MIENFIPDYRDPLTGILVIVLFIFLASFFTYTYSKYKERLSRKEYRKLLKRFELGTLKEEDYIHLYSTYNLPFDSILLLASSFIHTGKYDRAISVYLTLLEHVKEPVKKEELLELLGSAYFKSGMLQRSRDIYLKILKFRPRNKTALHHLLLIFQNLKEFDLAQEVIDSLEELEEKHHKERIYLQTLKLLNDPMLSYEKKAQLLLKVYMENEKTERLTANYLVQYNKELFWQNIEKFHPMKIIDILWYLDFEDIDWDKVNSTLILKEIYNAKGYILDDIHQSDQFELNALIAVRHSHVKSDLDLNFDFICTKCKKNHPVYESRCPHCQDPLSFVVEPKLGKATINLSSLV